MLQRQGYTVSHLGRARARKGGIRTYVWDVDKFMIEDGAIENADAIVHLAGANIGEKPWTPERKREILESRTHSAALLADALAKKTHRVKVVVAASATGYYGFNDNTVPYHEDSPSGNDFQAQMTVAWEQALHKLDHLVDRLVILRTGVVLSNEGGMLKEIAAPIRAWVGAALGTGRQCITWIHIDDLCALYQRAIDDSLMAGIYNAVAPKPATNREVTRAMGTALRRPILLPRIPGFVIKLVFGEMSELVLRGNQVSADKILQTGFRFQYSELQNAINDLLKR